MSHLKLTLLCMLFLQTSQAQNSIPSSFDAREKWPNCKSIGKITNNQKCQANWAFAIVSTISDIICIGSSGSKQVELSPQDLLSCCDNCGSCEFKGYTNALDRSTNSILYYIEKGIVSGGDEGCLPYSEATALFQEIPACPSQCQNGSSFLSDKHYGKSYTFIGKNETDIQKEIMNNGPVITGFRLFQDFVDYKGGVYNRSAESEDLGFTYGKIIGWGNESGQPYWLIANSWGTEWGEKGFVKFLRGKNEDLVENWIIAVRGGGFAVSYSWFLIIVALFVTI